MAQTTITITESVTRTYVVTDSELEGLGVPTETDALKALDTDELGVALIESGLEDRYEVTEREIDIAAGRA